MDPDAEARFTRIYEAHYAQVVAYCGRRVGRVEAEDIASDVFAVLWTKIEDVDPARALPWLYGVAFRAIGNGLRSSRRRRRLRDRVGGLARPSVRGPDEILVQREEDRLLIEQLTRLRPSDQEILRLAAWESLDSAHIAEVVGCSVSAARQRLSRAKRRLTSQLSKSPTESITTDMSTMEGGSI